MPPQTQPLLALENLSYLGNFRLPDTDGQPPSGETNKFRYSIGAMSMGPDGTSLYFGCHTHGNKLSRVTIPAIGGTASVVKTCTTIPNLQAIDPNTGESKVVSGSLSWNGRTIVSAHVFYDGSGNATASHWAAQPDLTGFIGPVKVGTFPSSPGWTGGPMGVIPPEWRDLLGGPAATSLWGVSVISRSSYGPDLVIFDPDDVGVVSPVPGTRLLGYDTAHPLAPWGTQNDLFHGATKCAGFAFVEGTRSLLVFGRHGENYCYGTGTYCNDPMITSQGNHSFPYHQQIWAYDANDLLAVKQGSMQYWEVQPYGVWVLTLIYQPGYADLKSATYDPATNRIYVLGLAGGDIPRVHVLQVTLPAANVDCAGEWSAWAPTEDWGPCLSGEQSRQETRTFTVTTPAEGSGTACPTSPEFRTVTQPCAPAGTGQRSRMVICG
jgi:hypothetical protein